MLTAFKSTGTPKYNPVQQGWEFRVIHITMFSPKCKITRCTNKGTAYSTTRGLTFKGLAICVEILFGTKASAWSQMSIFWKT